MYVQEVMGLATIAGAKRRLAFLKPNFSTVISPTLCTSKPAASEGMYTMIVLSAFTVLSGTTHCIEVSVVGFHYCSTLGLPSLFESWNSSYYADLPRQLAPHLNRQHHRVTTIT